MTNRKIWLRAVLVVFVTAASGNLALAADEDVTGIWQKEIKTGLNVLQSSYSNNWNGGEKGSVVWTGSLDARFEKQFNERVNWRNTLKLAYGQTHQQERNETGALFWQKPDKTDDIIDFESFFRWTMNSGWDPYVSVNFTSLFQDLTDGHGRAMNFNPMSFKESAGISRKFIDQDNRKLMTRLGVALAQYRRSFLSYFL